MCEGTLGHSAHCLTGTRSDKPQITKSWRSCSKARKDKIAGQGECSCLTTDLGQMLQIPLIGMLLDWSLAFTPSSMGKLTNGLIWQNPFTECYDKDHY